MSKQLDLIEDPGLRAIAERYRLDNWNWGNGNDRADSLAMEGAALFIRDVGAGRRFEFPKIWGPNQDGFNGPDVADPLTIYMIEEEVRADSFSLADVLKRDIDQCMEDGSFSQGLKEISQGLKELAQRIDEVVSPEEG